MLPGRSLFWKKRRGRGATKVVLSSSAAIYGDNPVTPKVETMPPEPNSPYASTKLEGEFYCNMFTDAGRIPAVCLRYFNVFGPRQNPKSQYAAAVPSSLTMQCGTRRSRFTATANKRAILFL